MWLHAKTPEGDDIIVKYSTLQSIWQTATDELTLGSPHGTVVATIHSDLISAEQLAGLIKDALYNTSSEDIDPTWCDCS